MTRRTSLVQVRMLISHFTPAVIIWPLLLTDLQAAAAQANLFCILTAQHCVWKLPWHPRGPHGQYAFLWETDLKNSEVLSKIFPTFSPRLTFGNVSHAESLTRYIEQLLSFEISTAKAFTVHQFQTGTCNWRWKPVVLPSKPADPLNVSLWMS